MPRKPRIEYEGAVYHVMCRGDRRERIVRGDADYELFLATLAGACERTGWIVHSYVIMPNHYHLLLETPEGNLVAGMKWLQGTYTQRFNARHRESGHLFQGRYKALVLDSQERAYYRLVSDYIHLNPARAKLHKKEAPRLEDYEWSSYRAYIGQVKCPGYLHRGQILWSHGWEDTLRGRRAYGEYMARRVADIMGKGKAKRLLEKEWKTIRRGWYLGGAEFREEMLERLGRVIKGRKRESYAGAEVCRHDEQEGERLLGKGLKALGCTMETMRALSPSDIRKQGMIWLLRTQTTCGAEWINRRLAVGHASNISRAMRAMNESPKPAAGAIKRKLLTCKD